jgi:hypothetical protein
MAHKEGADIAASVLWPGVTGPADVEYWLAGSMPVTLVVSNPASGEAIGSP